MWSFWSSVLDTLKICSLFHKVNDPIFAVLRVGRYGLEYTISLSRTVRFVRL